MTSRRRSRSSAAAAPAVIGPRPSAASRRLGTHVGRRGPRRARSRPAPTSRTPGRWRTAPRTDRPVGDRDDTRSAPSSRSTTAARVDVDAATAAASVARSAPSCFGSRGNAVRGSKPAGRSNASPRGRYDALRSGRRGTSGLVVPWSCPTTYQNPSRSSRPYGSRRRSLPGRRSDRARLLRLAQHRQAGQRGHVAGTATRAATVPPELPQRLLSSAGRRRRPPPATHASRRLQLEVGEL